MELYVTLNGKYPRSESLIRATRDYDRGRIDSTALNHVYEEDYRALHDLQRDWPWVSDGLLNWQDLLRPFAEVIPGTQVLGLVRYYETNTFYRLLSFPGLNLQGLHETWVSKYFRFGNLAILPGPALFARFSEGLSLPQIYTLLQETMALLKAQGSRVFYLQEPELVYRGNSELPPGYASFIQEVRKVIDDGTLIVNPYFGSVLPLLRELLQLEVDGIGVDFLTNAIEDLIEAGWDPAKGMLAGVVDTENSYQEQAEDLQAVLTQIRETLRPRFLVLTGHADFEFLPRSVADRKIAFLQKVKEVLA